MAGSPIYDKMVKEKGFDPHKGSIYDTPKAKKSAPPAKAPAAKKEPGQPKSRAAAKQVAKTTKAAAKQTKKGK